MDDGIGSGYWFVAHRYGLGATPVTWQGWLAVALMLALIFADQRWVRTPAAYLVAALVVISFTALIAAFTEGGLRWRWGDR